MAGRKPLDEPDDALRASAIALGNAIRTLREDRQWSRAELLDRFYTQLEIAGVDYAVKGDWWLSGIENGDKAKQLPRAYLDAFIRALGCTRLEAVGLLVLADLNTLPTPADSAYAAGLTYVLTEVFSTALTLLAAQLDESTAAQLDEQEWLEIGTSVLEVAVANLKPVRSSLD